MRAPKNKLSGSFIKTVGHKAAQDTSVSCSAEVKYPPIDHLILKGSWYEIGVAYGRAQRGIVRYTMRAWATFHAGGRRLAVLSEYIRRSEKFLSEHFPSHLAEMHGIADGAEVDFPLVLAACFPAGMESLADATLPGEPTRQCTSIMFPASEWGPLLGGTLDDPPIHIIMTVYPDEGIPYTAATWPGWTFGIWGGMNAKGLAICGASAKAHRPENRRTDRRIFGLDTVYPPTVLLRSCATVSEALERMSAPDIMADNNYSLMDATGRGVRVQGYEGDSMKLRIVEMSAREGLCCGNFYTWELTGKDSKDFPEFPEKDAIFSRYRSVKRAVEKHKGNYTVDAMKHVLTSHEGDPDKLETVCNSHTDIAMVAAPQKGKLLFAHKPPCLTGFQDYSFKSTASKTQ